MCYVNLKKQDGLFKISVIDDGQGIKPKTKAKPNASESASLSHPKSLGIVGMRERISRIGGEFKIHSIPGSGTRVEIVLAV